MKKLLVAVLTAAVVSGAMVACGDSTRPNIPVVAGSWTYNVNLSGSGATCSIFGTFLELTQSGSTFTGTYSGGTLICSGAGFTLSNPVGSGSVINGSVTDAGAVSFDLDTQDWRNAGTLGLNSMSGTTTMKLDLGTPTGVVTLLGGFSAAR